MLNKSKLRGAAYRRLKVNMEENLTKYAGSIDACVKKQENIGRANDENKQQKQDPQSKNKKRGLFHSVNV